MSSSPSSSPPSSVCACAPGKVILFGEHAVVYGEPAMAACLSDLRVWVKVTRLSNSQLEVRLPDLPTVPPIVVVPVADILKLVLQRPPTSEDTDQIHRLLWLHLEAEPPFSELALSALTPVVYLVHQLASSFLRDGAGPSSKSGLSIVVRSKDLPVGAGLGSSAAFSVACAAALVRLTLWNPPASSSLSPLLSDDPSSILQQQQQQQQQQGQPSHSQLETINQYAFYSEMLLHGTPSGIDNTVSTFGGAIVYIKDIATGHVTMETLSNFPPLNLILTNTKVPRSTKLLVARVRGMYEQHTLVVQSMLQAMGAITRQFRDWVVDQTVPDHGAQIMTLIQTNQHLLRAVGVSHPSLDSIEPLVEEALRDMNFGDNNTDTSVLTATKLTGAGGGGCAMTLIRPDLSTTQAQQVMETIISKLYAISFLGWSKWKYQCLKSRVGGAGVLWLDPKDFPDDDHRHLVIESRTTTVLNTRRILVAASVVAVAAMTALKLIKR